MYTINIDNNIEKYRVTLNLESHIDANGTVILPYYNDPMIQQIESTIEEVYPYNEMFKPAEKYITNDVIISTEDEVIKHFKESSEKYFIVGSTDSKFSLLDLSFTMERAMNLDIENRGRLSKTLVRNPRIDELVDIISRTNGVENNSVRLELQNTEETISIDAVTPTKEIRYGKRIEISGTNVVGMILLDTDVRKEYVLYLDTPNPIFYVDNPDNITRFKYMRNNIDEKVKPTLNYYSDTIDEPKVLSEVFINRGINNAFEPIKKLKNIKDLNELTKTGFGYYKINTRGYNFKDK
jgi:hypothetical protein